MVGTSTMRSWWSGYRCYNQQDSSLYRPITMFGRNAGVCAIPVYDGLKAAEITLAAHGYTNVQSVWVPRACPTGISGKTCQEDGTNCSLHNYAIPFDIDPFGYGNPHFLKPFGNGWNFSDCKVTPEQVGAVESIKNTHGETYFRWLGWAIGDTMHFEPQVPPSRAEVDWTTVSGGNMAHEHTPMPDELPRDWADGTWAEWVQASGTDPKSRTWTFYREDLSWVYTRVIKPLQRRITSAEGDVDVLQAELKALKTRVSDLESKSGSGGGMAQSDVVALIESSTIQVPK